MAQGVWTIAEQRDGELRKITYEIISEGRRLADVLGQELTVILLGDDIQGKAAELGGITGKVATVYARDKKISIIERLLGHTLEEISNRLIQPIYSGSQLLLY